jgi:hypothetical protein
VQVFTGELQPVDAPAALQVTVLRPDQQRHFAPGDAETGGGLLLPAPLPAGVTG